MSYGAGVLLGVGLVGAWEAGWWLRRLHQRKVVFDQARARAAKLGRPLVVVGAPDRGPTPGPGCGDITVDLDGSACPVSIAADITKPLPLGDDSAVVFVSYVLEYVDDYAAGYRELLRVAGSPENLFIVRVEPWTLTAYLYPGAKRTVPPSLPGAR